MIDGIPTWLFYVGAAFMVTSSTGFALVGTRSPTAAYATFDLTRLASVNRLLHTRAVRFVVQGAMISLFLLVIVAGLFGRQQAGSNIATILTWTYWWTLLVVFVMVFGKAWCYACPWDALASWLERLTFWRVKPDGLSAGFSWPRALRNLYPATALFLVLTWLELGYGVTTRPELTALLGILMFFLTFVPLVIFERHAFCRYGCLVGRISGLYSLFAALEIRPRDAEICRACSTHDCYHGNERGYPCPTSQYLGAMTKNTYCIYCAECVQTCPHDNVAVNLRPFGQDMMKATQIRFDEAAMVIVMLAMTTFHGLTMTPAWGVTVTAIEHAFDWPYLAAFSIGMIGFLAAVTLAYVVFASWAHAAARVPGHPRKQIAIRYAYAFLPIALFYHFAHNSMHFFVEGAAIVPVLSDPFGWGWNLLGTASMRPGPLLPSWAIWSVMMTFLVTGQLWAMLAARRISHQMYTSDQDARRSRTPIVAAMIAYSILSLWIVAQPMQMRTAL